jgi:A/G-specific adenine glycosylase
VLKFEGLKNTDKKAFPNSRLLDWYERASRDLPWRETQDPYRIWLSEIILQQTRVDQGLPYYDRFVESFPTVHELANASEDAVMKLWEGLGYYSRARNLHFTAKYISEVLNGQFPNTHDGLLSLKGVGPYTAAAIGSIAFDLPVAAVDGNVYRVLSRYFGIEQSIDESVTKKQITQLAQSILSNARPGDHNQAMMELGATLCLPKNTECGACPLKGSCIANQLGIQGQLPVRSKKVKVRDRFFYYAVWMFEGKVAIDRRGEGDIWQGLYQFPLAESPKRLREPEIVDLFSLKTEFEVRNISEEFKHILSHQRIYSRFVMLELDEKPNSDFRWVRIDELRNFAFPRLIGRFLQKSSLVIDAEV